MKRQKMKMILHLLICILISFVFIYLLVFFGGWRLIESGDPILLELAVSILVGVVVFMVYELSVYCEQKIGALSDRVRELEKQMEERKKQ